MVWIKINDTKYLNSDLITSIDINFKNKKDLYTVTFFCNFGEFSSLSYTGTKHIELLSTSLKSSNDEINKTANQILINLLTELEVAKKKGEAVFDLTAIEYKIESKPINNNGNKIMGERNCNPNCPCWEKNITHPRVCPICGHTFKGNGWDGIDAHYKSKHEKDTSEPYNEWWGRMCDDHKGKS